MTEPPLTALLLNRIAATGPMRVSDYMAECLLHPAHGYYTTRDPLGAAGDFTTAPEISQMFGELIGLALAQAWMDQGRPAAICLAEPGPGRGTLMADILRAIAAAPGMAQAVTVHLVEASPTLRQAQSAALAGVSPHWHDRVDSLPQDQPLFLVANEFFDALPIRQFQREGDMWRERMIGAQDGRLRFGLGGPIDPPGLRTRIADTKDGDIVEVCPAASPIMTAIAQRIERQGGAALILDYGGWRSRGDTLQAVRAHQPIDVLAAPGESDLTAHVDFEALAQAAAPAEALQISQMVSQGVFLEQLGITARAQRLAGQLTGDALRTHVAAHRRLTHPDEMGTVFKVIGLAPRTAPQIAGLHV